MTDTQQLSFDVQPHPHARERDGWLLGALKVSLDLNVPADLQPGDELRVIVSGPDGEVIAQTAVEVEGVAFVPIKDHGSVIGTTRVHKAKAR